MNPLPLLTALLLLVLGLVALAWGHARLIAWLAVGGILCVAITVTLVVALAML